MKPKFILRNSSLFKWLTRERADLEAQGATGFTWREFLVKAGAITMILGLIKLIGVIYFSSSAS